VTLIDAVAEHNMVSSRWAIAMDAAPVKLSELRDALLFVSSGINVGTDSAAYIAIDAGKIYWKSDWENPDDPLPEDLEESDNYIEVPDKRLLNLGRALVMAFVEEASPRDFQRVAGFFQRRGAYARFKDLLDDRGLLRRWYDFENQAEKEALQAWCAENEIPMIDDEVSQPGPG
jgi:hypothetical protein